MVKWAKRRSKARLAEFSQSNLHSSRATLYETL